MALQATVVFSQWLQNQHQTMLLHPLPFSLFFLSLCLLLWFNYSSKKKTMNLPPSPPRLPFIGHLHLLGSLPHRNLQLLSKKHGPLMLLHLGQIPTLIVSSAEMVKQILKTHDVTFSNRPVTTCSKAFLYGDKDMVFAPYGDYWRQMRKCCVVDLLSVKRVQSFRFVREEETADMVSKIKQISLRGEEVNLGDLLATATNNMISRIALGRRFEGELGKTEYAELTEKAMKLFGFPSVEDMFPSLKWIDVLTGLDKRMKKTSEAMLQLYDKVIEEHLVARKKGSGSTKDFVDLLLDYEEDSSSLGVEFTRENLKAVLMDVFIAGSDTISTTLQWAIAELINHPNMMKYVQEEVRQVVGIETEANVKENDIHQMHYLHCVVKETLRLHPPVVLILRSASAISGAIIESYNIPAKTRVMINVWAIARDPNVWDKPNEFIPERFINNEIDFRGQDFEFIPFGAGRRMCPGISFGTTSIEFLLANILYLFNWKSPNDKDIDMIESFGLSVPMKFSLCLIPTSHKF